VLLAYVALTVAVTWPLALRLPEALPNDLGDPLLSTWTLWWNATVFPLSDRWWDGTMFFPAPDALALSDHRLGIGLLATPVIWLGGSPVTAHNVAFLASFALSAFAAYALGWTLTRHSGAAFLAGLVFGFNPFRAGHLSHLELLCAFWLPLALLALHRYRDSARPAWLALLAAALTMQAYTSAYYFAFFAVIIGPWLLWFARGLSLTQLGAVAVSLAAPLALALPTVMRYRHAHESMGLARTIGDVEHFSADLIGLVTAPHPIVLWPTPSGWDRAEGALYPGIVAVSIVVAGVVAGRAGLVKPLFPALRWLRYGVLALAAIFAIAAATVAIVGPVAAAVGGVDVSASHPFKPLSIALLCVMALAFTSGRMRAAWQQRSGLAFYVVATLAMWAFALGPTGRVLGERFLYKAPYAWFMLIPGVDTGFRVPARFGMLAALMLCACTAIAWQRLTAGRARRAVTIATVAVAVAVVADSWIEPLALPAPPRAFALPASVPADAVVVELPLGAFEDAAAMYRSIEHGRKTLNGLSGYAPPHYQVIHAALAEGRVEALEALAERAPLIVFVDRLAAGSHLTARVGAVPSAERLRSDDTHDVLLIPRRQQTETRRVDLSTTIRMQSGQASTGVLSPAELSDGDRATGWLTPSQRGDEAFDADLGAVHHVSGVVLMLGAWPGGFPRALHIQTSTDGSTWQDAWHGDMAAIAVRAAMDDQRDVTIPLSFSPRQGRFVRVRQIGWSALPWAVAEFGVMAVDN
jgi:hypothetical protein